MDDRARMIESARRLARRNARATGTPYQTCLDEVARALGRAHWAAFTADPVPVPRDDAPVPGLPVNLPDFAVRWNLPPDRRPDDLRTFRFVPGFNPLAADELPPAGPARDERIEQIADVLCSVKTRGGDYFVVRAHEALVAFVHLEIGRAAARGTTPSLAAMIDDIANGTRETAASYDPDRLDGPSRARGPVGAWLSSLVTEAVESGYHPAVRTTLLPLVDMHDRERSGVLGTMDWALLPFRNPAIRSIAG